MNMIRNGPTIRLSSTPGRRRTSRSSLPVNEPMRIRLSTMLRMGHRSWLAAVRVEHSAFGSSLLDEAREDLVEGRLMLLDAVDLDAVPAKRVDDRRRQGPRGLHRGDELSRRRLPDVQH